VQQQDRAQRQGEVGDLAAETVQDAGEPEAAEVGAAQQVIVAQLGAQGGKNKKSNTEKMLTVNDTSAPVAVGWREALQSQIPFHS
jgi:hypothetical protein